MKLKNIASLALAGVMAVSMLAGCSTTGTSDNGGASSEETNTSNGYSAVLAENLPDVEKKDYVTFQDNSSDAAALEKALNNVSASTIDSIVSYGKAKTAIHIGTYVNYKDISQMIDDLKDTLDIVDDDLQVNDMGLNYQSKPQNVSANKLMNRNVNDATLFVVDGSVGVDQAIAQVASGVKSVMTDGLPETGTTSDSGEVFNYNYTISVSVAKKAGTDGAASLNFILVTVSRTVTADAK